MEPEAFDYALNTAYEYIYNNESELEPLQYPLAMSRFKVPRFANDLYTDDTNQYFTYSGTANSLIVTKEKDGRYKNLTLRAYSGDSFKFYFQAGSGISDSDLYFSGPLTTSGVYSTMTQYATQSGALTNAITFSAPTNNSSVYTLPSIQNLNWIRLFHQSTDGTTPYRIYQFLPRTLIQVDDLEADVIDAVTIRVSGSIVVTADNLANGSITGAKIMAGTVSGVLITPGTITANEISAGTITANKLNVTQLDAVAANMGNLVVNSGISVAANGYITVPSGYIEAGKARLDSTGIHIGDVASSNLPSITDTLRIAGSGVGGNIVGMALYNGAFSATIPQALMQLDGTNALEIENNAPESALINFNFPTNGLDQSASVQIYNGDLNLRKSPSSPADITSGTIRGWDSDNTLRYELGPDQLLLNNNSSNTFVVNSSDGSITTSGNLYVGGVTTADNNIDVNGTVTTEFAVRAKSELNVGYDGSAYAFNVDTAGQITSKVRSTEMGYLTARRTGTLAITTAGTTIIWQAYPRYNNISVSSSDITINNAGYYTFSATFATVANLTSLRMTLQRGTINYVSTLHGAGLSTGGGYMFNFSIGFYATAGSVYRVVLTPSSNTTLNASNEGFAAPSPIMNIYQAIGDIV